MPQPTGTIKIAGSVEATLRFTEHDVWRGIKRWIARPTSDLVVFVDELASQRLLITERPTIVTNGPLNLEYSITVDGRTAECTHGLGRRTYWDIGGVIPFRGIQLLAPNSIAWADDWRRVDAMSLGKVVEANQSLHDTGDAPEHGALPAWSNDAIVSIAQGRTLGHFPCMFRDLATLEPITTFGYFMGPNKWTTKAVSSPAGLGCKLDNAHVPLLWKPALEAVRGTILERFTYENAKLSAVFHVQSDWPGDIARKPEVRMQRALRNVAAFLIEADAYGDNDAAVQFCRVAASKAVFTFDASPLWAVKGGTRDGGRFVALWEYAQLAYALHLCELYFHKPSDYLERLLDWTFKLGVMMPYKLAISDGTREYTLSEIRTIEQKAIDAAIDAGTPRTRYHELALFDWVRVERGMQPVKQLDTYIMLDTPNWAGFRLPMVAKPVVKYRASSEIKTAPETDSVDQACADAATLLDQALNVWDPSVPFETTVRIARTAN